MRKIKSLILALSLSPLLLSAWQLPSQAEISQNPPSKGIAGSTSGNNTGAAGSTIFSVPITVQNGGTTTTGNITVTPGEAGTPPVITVPSTVQAAVNTSAQSAVVTLQTGGLTQQQVADVVKSLTQTIANNTQGKVPNGVVVKTGGGEIQTFPTLQSAIVQLLNGSITSLLVNQSVSVTIGNKTVVISNTGE